MTTKWGESTIGDEFEVQLGKRVDTAVARGVPKFCINNRGVRWGRIDVAEAATELLSKADLRDLRLCYGDVLVCEGGEIGRASVWRDEVPEAYYLNTLHRLRSKGRYKPDLIAALLERWAATGELQALVGRSSLAHLTKENLLRVPLPMPSPGEQARIAEALRGTDEFVQALERLIAKKRDVKQGMMQELLTGRVRLPGFGEPWGAGAIGRLIDGLVAGTSVRSVEGTTGPAVLKTSAVRGGKLDPHEVKTILPQDIGRARCNLEGDSIVVSRMNTPAMVGAVGYVEQSDPSIYLPDRLWLARPCPGAGTSMRWLAALLSQGATAEAVRSLATGTSNSMKNIAKERFLALTVPTPSSREQQAIGAVLADADAEITVFERRLESARAVKTGMMQELLTGRTRLRVEAAS